MLGTYLSIELEKVVYKVILEATITACSNDECIHGQASARLCAKRTLCVRKRYN